MKINSILNRYIFKEMMSPFVLSIFFCTFVLLMAEMVKITNWVVNYDVSLLPVVLMILYSIPLVMVFVIPMSIMMSILLTFLRMSSDNEIMALKSGGLSIYRLLPPVILFGLFGLVTTLYITVFVTPRASTAIEDLTFNVAASNIDIGLKERTFNDSFKNVVLYINKFDPKRNEFLDVFIEDKRQKGFISTVVAPRGKLFSEPDKFVYHLLLYNGTIHQTNLDDRTANSIGFDFYKLSLNFQDELSSARRRRRHSAERGLLELIQYAKSFKVKDKVYYRVLIDLHLKFSIPVACLALGLLAMPLGLHSRSNKRTFGLIMGLFLILIYYLMVSAGMVFGKTGRLPPAIGMWLPNVLMGAAAIYLLVRSAKEKSVYIDFVEAWIQNKLSGLRRV